MQLSLDNEAASLDNLLRTKATPRSSATNTRARLTSSPNKEAYVATQDFTRIPPTQPETTCPHGYPPDCTICAAIEELDRIFNRPTFTEQILKFLAR